MKSSRNPFGASPSVPTQAAREQCHRELLADQSGPSQAEPILGPNPRICPSQGRSPRLNSHSSLISHPLFSNVPRQRLKKYPYTMSEIPSLGIYIHEHWLFLAIAAKPARELKPAAQADARGHTKFAECGPHRSLTTQRKPANPLGRLPNPVSESDGAKSPERGGKKIKCDHLRQNPSSQTA
jgi:hypothetical protein